MNLFLGVVLAFLFCQSELLAKPSCKELNSRWKADYHHEFKILWPKKEFSCPSYTASVAETIYYLRKIAVEDGVHYDDFVTRRLNGINYESVSSDFPWAYAVESNGVITLFDRFMQDKDILRRLQSIIHESRHTYSDDPEHELCLRGPNQGKLICDGEFMPFTEKGGGYNYEFHFLYQIATGKIKSELSPIVAKYTLRYMLFTRFNKITNEQIRQFTNEN